MNAKISVFDICVEAIMYLLYLFLYNLHDYTFKTIINPLLRNVVKWSNTI